MRKPEETEMITEAVVYDKQDDCNYYLFNGDISGYFYVIDKKSNFGRTRIHKERDTILWHQEKRSNQTTRLISNALSSRVSAVRRYIGHHVMKLLNLRG